MKKLIVLLLVGTMLFSAYTAFAEGFGIQMIDKNTAQEVLSLDDIKAGESCKIDGFATIKPGEFAWHDWFAQFLKGKASADMDSDWKPQDHRDSWRIYSSKPDGNSTRDYYINAKPIHSGKDADFAWLPIDIVNRHQTEKNFIEIATVKVVFDEEFEFAGWVLQFDYDLCNKYVYVYNYENAAVRIAMHGEDVTTISPMYAGHYVFGCTLPMDVIQGNEPLRMEIKLGDNEIIYHIRK